MTRIQDKPRRAPVASSSASPARSSDHAAPVRAPADWRALLGDRTPTPVQAGAIPALLSGRDVITTARTGSGKTLAFLIPAAARGIGMSAVRGMRPEVLVITPTRELAVQIRDVARELGMTAGRITGGITPGQTRSEATGKGLISGTPGRLKDLINRNELSLAGLRYVVLDEADELLSLGFLRDVGDILRAAQQQSANNGHLQVAMASATFPAEIRAVAERFMVNPERIDIAPARSDDAGANAADVLGGATGATHLLVNTTRDQVLDLAADRAREVLREPGGCVVIFSRTKSLVKRRAEKLNELLPGEIVSPLEGNMDQKKRERTMALLREGKSRVLIATDIAGRGIDLPEVRLVIHMDISSTAEDHVHRSGRTARAGRPGTNLVLLIPEQRALWQNVRRKLPGALHPPLTREESQIDKEIQEKQGQGRGQQGPGGGRQGQPRAQGQQPRTQSAGQGGGHGGARSSQVERPRQGSQGRSDSAAGTGAGRVGPQRPRGRGGRR
ncbi:DEAD/DEAH box helicase [Deinococcus sp. 6YEL10]|uniref:DEAD/DEAH box helicase n=1 Tax=Deinococcus sp. 6YEL10 TaxID=2745870 RepID=UPI001E3A1780|nr:DEAD/DEAH box helicase [Deinococcus sp. 6YEL10]MCD0161610.1 DEAD/DEAH box helicase [Deinococcus sp. 6YEL10]